MAKFMLDEDGKNSISTDELLNILHTNHHMKQKTDNRDVCFNTNNHSKMWVNTNPYDLIMSMNNVLTEHINDNSVCILSLLHDKPKCIFNENGICDCDTCIQKWLNK